MRDKKYLGDFWVKSGKLVVSDPCYELDSRHIADKLKSKKGVWKAYIISYRDKHINERQSILVHHADHKIRSNTIMGILPVGLGVDSGMIAVCDRKYWQDDSVIPKGFFSDPDYAPNWYEMMCKVVRSDKSAGVVPYGCVSSTAYGDGTYMLEGIKKDGEFVAFRVHLV